MQATLGELLHRVIDRIEERADELVVEMFAAYRSEIPDFAKADDDQFLDDAYKTSRWILLTSLEAIRSGRPLAPPELAMLRATGQRRAQNGFPLHAVLQAFHIGTAVAWKAALDETRSFRANELQVLMPATARILEIARQASAEMAQGYIDEQRRRSECRGQVQSLFFAKLLSDDFDVNTVTELARKLGYDFGEQHSALVIGMPEPEDTSVALAQCGHSLLLAGEKAGAIGYIAQDHLIFITRNSDDASDQCLIGEVLESATKRLGPAVIIAVGPPGRLVTGLHESYLDATATLNTSRQLKITGVVTYEQSLPTQLLCGNGRTRRYLCSIVEPLFVHDAEHKSRLVETLDTFFRSNGGTNLTAERLGVHRHTIDYRLQKIERVLGRDLRDSHARLLLELALRARRYNYC